MVRKDCTRSRGRNHYCTFFFLTCSLFPFIFTFTVTL
ncbi:hypothetical protein PMIN01_01511 [Paraphaeosphaeria minitans]|uniref:Uncharacterized protein n=1 Tax=Paraphaeosphaeria minitans TaxID=565426 RepID=A0A9P6GUA7_9PLEO|nr:hypothetical protein PMIN01_01511 [Paraphaeosphaeria minitans]